MVEKLPEKILITGATGNVGQAVIKNLRPEQKQGILFATQKRDDLNTNKAFFDFSDLKGSGEAIVATDILFLLRPPHLTDIRGIFEPLIELCARKGVKHIVFLSVQGAERTSIIPHAKIEKLIVKSGIPYTFIRPSYFMQNLSTVFLKDIHQHNQIVIPAGKAKFLWVDVNDIGKAVAAVLADVSKHRNKAYTITGKEHLNFSQAADLLSSVTGKSIEYKSPNPISFYFKKRAEGVDSGFIFVMLALHVLPRFDKVPEISEDFTTLTGEQPNTLKQFLIENKSLFF